MFNFSKMFPGGWAGEAGGAGGGGGIGSSVLGFVTQALELGTEQQMMKAEERKLSTGYHLQKSAISKQQRQYTGKAKSNMGASGTDIDLEYIANLDYEFELDKAILKAEYDIANRAMKDERHMALYKGISGMIMGTINNKTTDAKTQDPLAGVGGVGTSVPKAQGSNYSITGKTQPTNYGVGMKKPDWYASMFGVS